MTTFPDLPADGYAVLVREETDKPLPEKITQSTRYAYFKTIAHGGKSIIQSCKDLHLGRVICYKTLKPEFADDPLEQRRFLREARVAAMLQHPNTVPTYEIGRTSSGHYFFTMKLVHGYTLREVLDFRERYDLRQLVDVIIQIAHALEYAHSHRVLHRDIKPDNILVGPFGEVLLLDWGLAKVWDADGGGSATREAPAKPDNEPVLPITGQGNLQGTLAYMSPEQVRRDPEIDYRSDIYSLGVVLYEILAGRTPGTSETTSELIEEIQHVTPPPPSELAQLPVPKLLDALAMRCIAKQPADRPQQWHEFIRLLQEDWTSTRSKR